jgi:hypothetical protein
VKRNNEEIENGNLKAFQKDPRNAVGDDFFWKVKYYPSYQSNAHLVLLDYLCQVWQHHGQEKKLLHN